VRLSISRAWEESWRIFARDGALLIAVALALLVLPQIVVRLIAPPTGSEAGLGERLVAFAAALVGIIGQLAIVRLALGPSTSVGQAIRHGARRFPSMLGALVILILGLALLLIPVMAVLIAAGVMQVPVAGQQPSASFSLVVVLLLIGCLVLAVRLIMLTVPIASAEPVGPLGIIKRSWRLSAGRFWPLFGLEVLLLIAALFLLAAGQFVGGSLAGLVGDIERFSLPALIFAIVVALAQASFTLLASVMMARVYAQLSGAGEPQASVPTTGT
jgi:hypothetical protein